MKNRSDSYPSRQRMFVIPQGTRKHTSEHARVKEFIAQQLDIACQRSPCKYRSGQPTAKPGTNIDPIALEAYMYILKHMNPNIVDPHMFLGAYELEREALAMTNNLLGNKGSDGFFLSGGSESIAQALWTYHNKFFKDRDIPIDEIGIARAQSALGVQPSIIAPLDAHFALDKSISLLGIGKENIGTYGVTEAFTTDYDELERTVRELYASNKPLFANFCVAGDTQKGLVQDVKRISALVEHVANEHGYEAPPTIVDAAAQYLFLGVMKDSPRYLRDMPRWDFHVPAVQAIIADAHKNEIPYGAGMLLLRNQGDVLYTDQEQSYLSKDLITHVKDMSDEHRAAAQHNSTISTSRSGAAAAATWAHYRYYGLEGLREKKEKIWDLVQQAATELKQYDVLCEPETANVALRLKHEPTAERHKQVYARINECPEDNLYISYSSSIAARKKTDIGSDAASGLYLHFMEHNTPENTELLIHRLDEEAKNI